MKTSKDGDGTTSLGNLLLCLTVLIEKRALPAFRYSFQFMPVVSHPLAMLRCVKPSSIFSMTDLLIGTGKLLLSLVEDLSSPG